jgi:hypothetical protein
VPGQRVDFGDRERFAICESLLAIARGLPAIRRCRVAVPSGLRALLGGLLAEVPGALTLLRGANDDLRDGDRQFVVLLEFGVALRHRQIARGGSPIAHQRRQVAGCGGLVSFMGAFKACRGGVLTLERRAPTDFTAGLVLSGIDALREVAIAGGLIAIGGGLVAFGASLVSLTASLIAVGERLIAVRERLIAVRERLLVTETR